MKEFWLQLLNNCEMLELVHHLLSLIGDGLQAILELIFGGEGDPFGNFLAILAFLYNPHLPSSLARRSRKIFGLLERLGELLGIDADTLTSTNQRRNA